MIKKAPQYQFFFFLLLRVNDRDMVRKIISEIGLKPVIKDIGNGNLILD
jgi:hypothetical protein